MKKRYVIIVAACVVLTAVIANYRLGLTNFLYYNKDIDTSKKTGYFLRVAELYGSTLYDFIDFADVIFTGTVVSEGEGFTDEWMFCESGDDVHSVEFALTSFEIEVDNILYGTAPETLTFVQMGAPASNELEMQVEPGDVVTIIASRSDEGYYCSVSCENGVFYHREDGLFSYSNLPEICKYDGIGERVLETDIHRIVLFNGLSPERNFFHRNRVD